jgi:biofilm PGA synthesis N-glycosyltransferase PgaC
MTRVAEVLFWASLIVTFYAYAGYPLLLLLLTSLKKVFYPKKNSTLTDMPSVSLIVTAFNEEAVIESKIRNVQQLQYPSSKLNVIFVTDGSTDRTVDIVRQYTFITSLHEPERKGKLSAMNRAMDHVNTGIVVFNDANGFMNPESITRMVSHYADPKVGGVSGEKRILMSNGTIAPGEGLYWRYESLLKKLDSDLLTIVGAAGELFSMRTELYNKLDPSVIIEDFVQSLLLCHRGYLVRYEPGAYSAEAASLDLRDEMARKVRISAGAFQAMKMLLPLLNLFRHPLLTFMYVSHRVLRWTICPPALIVLFLSNAIIYIDTEDAVFGMLLLMQLFFYFLAFTGWLYAMHNRKIPLLYVPFYFTFMNWCVFAGFFRYLAGRQGGVWDKAKRV